MLRTIYHPIHVAVTDPASPVNITHKLPDHFRKVTGVRIQHRGGIEQMGKGRIVVSNGSTGEAPTDGVIAVNPRFPWLNDVTPVMGVDSPVFVDANLHTALIDSMNAANFPDMDRIGTAYLELNNQKTKLGNFYCDFERSLHGIAGFMEANEEIEIGTFLTGCYVNELRYDYYQKVAEGLDPIVVPNGYMATIWLRVVADIDESKQRNLTNVYRP